MTRVKLDVPLPKDTEVLFGGNTYTFDGQVRVEFAWVDFGIGAYEAWGARGYDSQMGPEDLEITGLDAVECDGEPIKPDDKIKSALLLALNAMLEDGRWADDLYENVREEYGS